MAFIITVAVICALWWFYWHLQQMTWEVKQKLDTLKTLSCELGKPGGPESVQPTPANGNGYVPGEEVWGGPYDPLLHPDPYTLSTTYRKQRVTFYNVNWPSLVAYSFSVAGEDGVIHSGFFDGTGGPFAGEIGHFDLDQDVGYGPNYDVTFDIDANAPGGTGYPSLIPGAPTYYVSITDIGP